MTPDLKPCPWCGYTDIQVQMVENRKVAAVCQSCLAQGPAVEQSANFVAVNEQARSRWNERDDR